MTNAEKRIWLIRYLLNENEKYGNIAIPQDESGQFNLYRSLVNVRPPEPIGEEYLKTEDDFLKEETAKKGVTHLSELTPVSGADYLWQGDITTLECDAVVNAANSRMLGCFQPLHNCIDNCIHTFAGVRLRLKCSEIMQAQGREEPTGQAKITPAYNLPCRYVLHTVGPVVSGRLTQRHCGLLASCYDSCLKLAEENGCRSVAFCCISTGVFGFPQREAAHVAVRTVEEYRRETGSRIKVIFNVFKDEDRKIYESILGQARQDQEDNRQG